MAPTSTNASTQSFTTPSSRDVDPSRRSSAAEEECLLIPVRSDGLQFIFSENRCEIVNLGQLISLMFGDFHVISN